MTFLGIYFLEWTQLLINGHWNEEYSKKPETPASPSLMESLRGVIGVIPVKTIIILPSDEGAIDLVLELFFLQGGTGGPPLVLQPANDNKKDT